MKYDEWILNHNCDDTEQLRFMEIRKDKKEQQRWILEQRFRQE